LKPKFLQQYLNLLHEKLADAAKEVLSLLDEQIFSVAHH